MSVEFTEESSQRLLAAVYPTRVEKVLEKFKMHIWTHLPNSRVGLWVDDLETWLRQRRVRRGKWDAGVDRSVWTKPKP